jgi:hypothetical protein
MKVCTKFQINLSTSGWENYIQSDMGTRTKSLIEALCSRLKNNHMITVSARRLSETFTLKTFTITVMLFVSQHNSVWLNMILIGSVCCSCVAFYKSFQNFFIFWILGLKFGTNLQEPIALRRLWIWPNRTISSPRIDRNPLDSTLIC